MSRTARSISFWFDYTCPYAYLASTRVGAAAERTGAALTYEPLLLGGIFRESGTPQKLFATLGAAKSAHNFTDMQRWAKRFGLTLRMPAGHPLRSVEALRATIATGIDTRVVDGFFRAYWVDGRPISTPEVIADVVSAAGHDATVVLEKITTDELKGDLRARTDRAIAAGVFGVPTFIVDGNDLYWGQDRLAFAFGLPQAIPNAPAKSMRHLEVFWDFSSPFSYLGASQVAAVARRTGARVTWKPLLLGGLFKSIGMSDVPIASFSPAKQKHTMEDIERWAKVWGVPYRFPSRFPMNTVKALRVFLALPESHRDAYREAVYRAYWAEDRDIGDLAVLGACVGDPDVAREAFAKAEGDEIKAALRASTDEARKRNVFGVPTFVVDGEDLYWGQDRLALVEEALVT